MKIVAMRRTGPSWEKLVASNMSYFTAHVSCEALMTKRVGDYADYDFRVVDDDYPLALPPDTVKWSSIL
jgi:hypothetical protein